MLVLKKGRSGEDAEKCHRAALAVGRGRKSLEIATLSRKDLQFLPFSSPAQGPQGRRATRLPRFFGEWGWWWWWGEILTRPAAPYVLSDTHSQQPVAAAQGLPLWLIGNQPTGEICPVVSSQPIRRQLAKREWSGRTRGLVVVVEVGGRRGSHLVLMVPQAALS